MPLDEEGAKWSCCQKLYAFMIRIPKGSTCLCRPVYQVPVEPGDPTPSASTTPIAASPSPSSGKIQKSSKKQIKVAPENLAKALDSIPEFEKHEQDNAPSFQHTPFSFQDVGLEKSKDEAGQSLDAPRALMPQPTAKPNGGSCCSKKPQTPAPEPAPSSCCRKSDPPSNGHVEQSGTNGAQHSYANFSAAPYAATPTSQVSQWQTYHPTSQTQFIQPGLVHQAPDHFSNNIPSYTTHPASEPSTNYSTHSVSGNMVFTPAAMMQSFPNSTYSSVVEGDKSHDCHCGDSCQCLGCASHPFNNTTRQHVQEMGLLVAFDGDDQNMNTLQGYQNGSTGGQSNANGTPFEYPYASYGSTINHGAQSIPIHYAEPTANSTNFHNGYPSPHAEYTMGQQMMEPSEYYTLEYPVGLPAGCSDITGSCQCGSDCTCIGCLTHSGHNGVALEPVSTDGPSMTPIMGPATSSAGGTHSGSNPLHFVPSSTSML
ncbi:hypothetical protein HFD88_006411 [Aspergillus terreus]|nr:hypothetical protein HFD88_006411 [Aspergillus terreus]